MAEELLATMQPLFLVMNGRRLFCNLHCDRDVRLRVLVLPPFAEEMNKCRPLLARVARALAAQGCACLLPDLYGTGDSGGAFGEADWNVWLADANALDAWLADRFPDSRSGLLAVRSGALLLGGMRGAAQGCTGTRVVCWQPVLDGRRYLQQVLRLRVMAGRMTGGEESVKSLEARLAGGETLEVAGYALSAALASGLSEATLSPASLARADGAVLLEFAASVLSEPSLPVARLTTAVREAGGAAEARTVACEQFWTTQEIAVPEAAVAATVAAFLQ